MKILFYLLAVASVFFPVFTPPASRISHADDLSTQIDEVNKAAALARRNGDLETVEEKRRERLAIIAQAAEGGVEDGSPWLKAYRALVDVDGSDDVGESVGLINELKYKDACDRLLQAFDASAEESSGPLLGDVAVRLFEVAQQARGVFQDALDDESPNSVAKTSEIIRVLRTALKRDPCCVVATPMLQYLIPSDPSEAFLRAEVRGDFRERQKELIDLTHPLVLGAEPGNIHVPIMPWHAPVELVKARSLRSLLQDLTYARVLTPEHLYYTDITVNGQAQKVVNYVIPGAIFLGTDALGQPFQLLYGQILLSRLTDHQGNLRSAAYFLQERQAAKKSSAWDHRYLELLWRLPSEEELKTSPRLRRLNEIVSALAFQKEFSLENERFRIYDFPIRQTEEFIKNATQILCVKDVDVFSKMKFVPNRNRVDQLSKISPPESRADLSPFDTTPRVKMRIAEIEDSNDPTKHPLVELLHGDLNPLLIVSERPSKDRAPSRPQLFSPAAPGESPFLKLDDGKRLCVAVDGRPESPCCWIEFDGATAYMPLLPRAVPDALLFGTTIGRAFTSLLTNAGYTEGEARGEILKAMEGKKVHVPAKFKKVLMARVNAEKRRLKEDAKAINESYASFMRENPWAWFFGHVPRRQGVPDDTALQGMMFLKMLEEEGWSGNPSLRSALTELFAVYGFRYLRDRRGNWIIHHDLVESEETKPSRVFGSDNPRFQHPYLFLAPDGKRKIELSQTYSWKDYERIKDNIYGEHLKKALLFHPCFPSLDVIDSDSRDRLEHPSKYAPEYLASDQMSDEDLSNRFLPSRGSKSSVEFNAVLSTVAVWMVGGDENQKVTLNNLANAFLSRLVQASGASREVEEIGDALRGLGQIETLFPSERSSELRKSWLGRYEEAYKRLFERVEPLWAVQLETARDYARRKYFHKAIVYYNDLLSQSHPSQETSSRVELFSSVPTTAQAKQFVGDLERFIDGQLFLLTVQAELAGVLNASGLASSAHFVWQRAVDDYDFLLQPAIAVAQDLLEAYGLKFDVRSTRVIEDLADTVSQCRRAIRQYNLEVDWRRVQEFQGDRLADGPGVKKLAVDGGATEVEEVIGLVLRDNEGDLSDEEFAMLEERLDAVLRSAALDFSSWLLLKKKLFDARPAYAVRSASAVPAWSWSPYEYQKEEGFRLSFEKIVRDSNSTEILEWCRMPLSDANERETASAYSFLLAWYWADMERLPLARAAIMNSAKVELAKSRRLESSTAGLLHEINAYAALTASASVLETLPGLSAYKADFGGMLEGQIRNWEKRWFAVGNYGPHASELRLELAGQAKMAVAAIAESSDSWRSERWFFPDYRFEFGAVPDYLAETLFNSPELFRELTAEEIEQRGKDAVEANAWALITVDDGKRFFDKQKVDTSLQEDILFLRD